MRLHTSSQSTNWNITNNTPLNRHSAKLSANHCAYSRSGTLRRWTRRRTNGCGSTTIVNRFCFPSGIDASPTSGLFRSHLRALPLHVLGKMGLWNGNITIWHRNVSAISAYESHAHMRCSATIWRRDSFDVGLSQLEQPCSLIVDPDQAKPKQPYNSCSSATSLSHEPIPLRTHIDRTIFFFAT
jgi:hypothetical protein